MKPCTLWHRLDQEEGWRFNHLEDGHATTPRPAPKCPNHVKAWAQGKWRADHAWLDAQNVVQPMREVSSS